MRCPLSPGESDPVTRGMGESQSSPFQLFLTREQLISFLKNHGEFFKDRDFHQHVKMLFSGGEAVGEEEEHNEFFHIPEQVFTQPVLQPPRYFPR